MPAAYCVIREAPHYRRWAFLEGLRKAGFEAIPNSPPVGGKQRGNWLVIWNRYGHFHEMACDFERGGGTVIVAENGYIGKDSEGRQRYALSLGWHQNPLVPPDGERFAALGIEVLPWRDSGQHVLICAQRGFGAPPHGMPGKWPGQAFQRVKAQTQRPVKLRPHPEDRNIPARDKPGPLEHDLTNCHAVVVWSSTSAVKALLAGVPVFYASEHFIAAPAAVRGMADIERPFLDDRLPGLERAAWGQWSVAEIESGEPFQRYRDQCTARAGSASIAA